MTHPTSQKHRISLIAGLILVATAVLSGFAVFGVMFGHAENLLGKSLQLSAQSRVQLVQAEIETGFDKATFMATRPFLINQVQRVNTNTDDGIVRASLDSVAQSFLQSNITAVAIFDKNGRELARSGSFEQKPEISAPLNLPGRVQLLSGGQLLLQVGVNINQAGQAVGKVMVEMALPSSTRSLKESNALGKSAEMAICAPSDVNMLCFPTTIRTNAITIPRVSADGNLLPMAYALAGETGFRTALDYRKQQVAAAYAPVGDLGLGMVLKIDRSELHGPALRQLQYVLPLLLGLLIMSMLALRWWLNPLVRKLELSEAQARTLGENLRISELTSRNITENMAQGVITITLENIVVRANATALELFGYEKIDLMGCDVLQLVPERHRRLYQDTITALAAQPKTFSIPEREVRCLRKDGSEFTASMSFSDIQLGTQRLFTALIIDITDRKRASAALRASELQLSQVINTVPALVSYLDVNQRFVFHNHAFEQVLGLSFEQINGHTIAEVFGQIFYQRIQEKVEEALRGHPVSYERVQITPQGTEKNYLMQYFPRHGEGADEGKVIGFYALGNDITELKQTSERLYQLANYDYLTGLPKRVLFKERLERAMGQAQVHGGLVAVVFLDLVRFKNINDTLGHDAGDQMLKEVAQRLLETVRSTDTVARISGDEFSIVLTDLEHKDDAARAAQRILQAFESPFRVNNRSLVMSASLGIAVFPLDTGIASELLSFADLAMYSAKAQGGNTRQFYAAKMTALAVDALALENELRQGLVRGEFFLNYQPIVNAGGNIVGAEALLRWQHGQRGLISPGSFIALAETTGLIVPIGNWVIRQACLQAKAWCQSHGALMGIAVNVSPRQFNDGNLAEIVKTILEETGLDPSVLNIEITEGVLMQNQESTQELFRQLSQLGASFSIDDFGIGYSNFAYLKRYPINSLKIDQTFIQNLATDPNNAPIVKSIISMAHSLGLKVIAEGVETREQMEFLLAQGCDFMQGFYFSRPLMPEAFTALLESGKPLPGNDAGDASSSAVAVAASR